MFMTGQTPLLKSMKSCSWQDKLHYWNPWSHVHDRTNSTTEIHEIMFMTGQTPLLKSMKSCSWQDKLHYWNPWSHVHDRTNSTTEIHEVMFMTGQTPLLKSMKSCSWQDKFHYWNPWSHLRDRTNSIIEIHEVRVQLLEWRVRHQCSGENSDKGVCCEHYQLKNIITEWQKSVISCCCF